jgi:Xaa-Pro dipeptidase
MVLVLDPVIRDSDGQFWQSKDTVVVTAGGNQVIGWYKDWREPYIPISSI